VTLALPFIIAGAIVLMSQRNAFRALSLGEETAQSLGVDVGRLRLLVIVGVALGSGAPLPSPVPSASLASSHRT